MNSRLKELADQADWWRPDGLPSDWDEEDYIVSPDRMKKFAELIVEECASMCDALKEQYFQNRKDTFDFNEKHIYAEGESACDILKCK